MTTAVGPDLKYTRGDIAPFGITFTRGGSALDLTGFTNFLLTINTDPNPTDQTNEVEQFTGTLDPDPTTGRVSFAPPNQAASDALPILEEAFYDVQWDNAASQKQTPIKGNFRIDQDITKD